MHPAFLPLKRYADFHGRAGRAQYWWFQDLYTLLALPPLALLLCGKKADSLNMIMLAVLALLLLALALTVPMLAVTVRRLHDIDRTGWWVVLLLIPYASVVLLVFTLLPGTPGDNSHGSPAQHEETA